MREAGALACAKINFTLDILDRRPDGYHEIRSVMQTISLADTLHIRLGTGTRGIKLNVGGEHADDIPVDESNLVIRAARAVLAEAGVDEDAVNVEIDLTKSIPAQAGLGGGSSDAATAIAVTNRFFDLGLPFDTLHRIASTIGSDVAFFLTGDTCLVEGIGEKVTLLDSRLCTAAERKHIVICKPNVNVPTALAYQELDKSRGDAFVGQDATSAWLSAFKAGRDLPLSNDFEPVILRHYPEIARVHALMAEAGADFGHQRPLLCGSGAAVLAVVDTDDDAQAMADAITRHRAGWVTTATTCAGNLDLA